MESKFCLYLNIFELGALIAVKYRKKKAQTKETKTSTQMAITSMSDISLNNNKPTKKHSYEEGKNDRTDSEDLFDDGHETRNGNENNNSDTEDMFQTDHVIETKGNAQKQLQFDKNIDRHIVDTMRDNQAISNEKEDSKSEDLFKIDNITDKPNDIKQGRKAANEVDAKTNMKSDDDVNGHLIDTPRVEVDNVFNKADTPHI